MDTKKRKLGLSLSGGGYRAAAFHLGTLKKLNSLGILDKVDVLSTISGGSITGAAWSLYSGDYIAFHEMMKKKIETKNVIGFVLTSFTFFLTALFILGFLGGSVWLTFTENAWLAFPVLIIFVVLLYKFQYQIFPVSGVIEKAYDKFFFEGKTLGNLKSYPVMAIGSSNLHTGKPFTFSHDKMSDSTYSYWDPPILFKPEKFPVSRAVMASSCVPFAFSPIGIHKDFFKDPNLYGTVVPKLIDGGVYDNQGIQKLTQAGSRYECDIIITSDAGGNFIAEEKYPNTIALLIRTVDLFMYRIKAFQMQQNIYRNTAAKPIAYFSLGWELKNLIPGFIRNLESGQILQEVLDAHNLLPQWVADPEKYTNQITAKLESNINYAGISSNALTKAEWEIARKVATNLTCLSSQKTDYLICHAETLTEAFVKLYCPMLLQGQQQSLSSVHNSEVQDNP